MRMFFGSTLLTITAFLVMACAAAPSATNNNPGGGSGGITLTSYYVATNGSDANTGLTKSDPLLSIQKAVELAVAAGQTPSIYVQEGYYTTNAGLTNAGIAIALTNGHNFSFYGGCDANFEQQAGHTSILDGRNVLDKLFSVSDSTNIVLNGFLFIRGNATVNNWGGAILLGGVYHSLITNCGFLTNNGFNGGAVCVSNSGTNVISAFFANNTGGSGGALYIFGVSYANGIYSSFSNNTASSSGGAIYFFGGGNSTIISGAFIGNRTTGYTSRGGAISINGESGTLIFDSVFYNNSATGDGNYGGGISSWGNGTRILNSIISNNLSGLHGGGVHFSGANSVLSNCLVANNRVTNATDTCRGGGVSLYGSSALVHTCAITGNDQHTEDVQGGGIAIAGDNCQIVTSVISGNKGYLGGGIYTISAYNFISNCMISNNLASIRGGGLAFLGAYNTNYAAICNNRVSNVGTPLGGGVYIGNSYCAIYGMISNNSTPTSTGYGGGIYIGNQSTLVNSLVCNNFAYGSGGIHVNSYSNYVTGAIINNTCINNGGGIYFEMNAHTNFLVGAVLTNNVSSNFLGCIGLETPVLLTISNNLIGCGTTNEAGIYEAGGNDTSGHIIVGNVFITNRMASVYHDDSFGTFAAADFAWINDFQKTSALSASGNIATNF